MRIINTLFLITLGTGLAFSNTAFSQALVQYSKSEVSVFAGMQKTKNGKVEDRWIEKWEIICSNLESRWKRSCSADLTSFFPCEKGNKRPIDILVSNWLTTKNKLFKFQSFDFEKGVLKFKLDFHHPTSGLPCKIAIDPKGMKVTDFVCEGKELASLGGEKLVPVKYSIIPKTYMYKPKCGYKINGLKK